MKCIRIGIIVAATTVGCSPFVPVINVSKVPASERVAASKVRADPVGERIGGDGIALGPVEATSCKFWLWDPPSSLANALEQLKIKAHRAGADAVVGTVCEKGGVSFSTNCFDTVTCLGTAVKLTGSP